MKPETKDVIAKLAKRKIAPDFEAIKDIAIVLEVSSVQEFWQFHDEVVNAWKEYKHG